MDASRERVAYANQNACSSVIDYILSFESFELNYVRKKKEFEHKGKKIITKIGAVFKLQRAIIVHIYFI